MGDPLRVIDFGSVTPLRSQTLWHAIAYGVSDGAPPTLSFARPSAAYVGIGYHRHLDEVDEKFCQAENLPIYRRMVGGGPVYLDADQLFFQICMPTAVVSPARLAAIRSLLAPAVVAFRTAGVGAELDDNLEICVGDQKICGHGAGQIEGAVVVCGNLIERFDHARATRILNLPGEVMRDETERLMRRYVTATPTHTETFRQAMVAAYATMLELPAVAGSLTDHEQAELERLDAQFESPEWLTGEHVRPRPGPRQVKVRAGVWVFSAEHDRARVIATVVDGVVEHARLHAPGLRLHELDAAEHAVTGLPLAQAADALAAFGEPGRTLAAALATADGKRL